MLTKKRVWPDYTRAFSPTSWRRRFAIRANAGFRERNAALDALRRLNPPGTVISFDGPEGVYALATEAQAVKRERKRDHLPTVTAPELIQLALARRAEGRPARIEDTIGPGGELATLTPSPVIPVPLCPTAEPRQCSPSPTSALWAGSMPAGQGEEEGFAPALEAGPPPAGPSNEKAIGLEGGRHASKETHAIPNLGGVVNTLPGIIQVATPIPSPTNVQGPTLNAGDDCDAKVDDGPRFSTYPLKTTLKAVEWLQRANVEWKSITPEVVELMAARLVKAGEA